MQRKSARKSEHCFKFDFVSFTEDLLMPNFITLAHHWLVGMRGGEKVLEQFSHLFPQAPIYTLVADASRLSPRLAAHPIHCSWLQRIPGSSRQYKKMLPLFPAAVSSLKVSGYPRLLLSSDASVIKGVHHSPDIPHVCYCHSPPRYLWDLQEDYLKSSETAGMLGRLAFRAVIPYVRDFDQRAAGKVTEFIANSRFVQDRIKHCYKREATVIHPPVEVESFDWHHAPEDFYLIVSQLVPYKRIDLAVEAFTRMKKRLVIIGEGPEINNLQKIAGPEVRFLGAQPFAVLKEHYERCTAFIFPGIEDFGITPLEAQAAGRPVIAFGKGGALETVVDGRTGLFFPEQTVDSLCEAVHRFERASFDPRIMRIQAALFSPESFREKIWSFLSSRFPDAFRD